VAIAKDPDGKYVRIEKAVHGQIYLCPQCADRFVARQATRRNGILRITLGQYVLAKEPATILLNIRLPQLFKKLTVFP